MLKHLVVAAVAAAGLVAGAGAARADEKKDKVVELWKKYSDLRDAKKYDEALAVVDEVQKVAPKNQYVWSERGFIFNEQEKYAAAVEACEKGLELDVDNSNAWRELGYALMMLKRHDDAAKALATAIEKDPRNWHAHDYLIQNYEKSGKFALAKKAKERLESWQAQARERDEKEKKEREEKNGDK